jgi:hypothetical protein
MICRRSILANIKTRLGCHRFRAIGIANSPEHKGTPEKARQIAAPESPKTTKPYGRTEDQIGLDEIERISI